MNLAPSYVLVQLFILIFFIYKIYDKYTNFHAFICCIFTCNRAQLASKLEFQIYDSISGKAISPNDSCNIVSVMLFGRDYGLRRLDVKNTLFAYYILQQKYKNRELINYSIIEKGH